MWFLKGLKRILMILFLFILIFQVNAQDDTKKTNGILLDFGYWTPQFNEAYTPARVPVSYMYKHLLETKVPRSYSKNNSVYSLGILGQKNVFNNVYFSSEFYYYYYSNEMHRSKDSIEHYYMFSDSIKSTIAYEFANEPYYEKWLNNYFLLKISINYKYKRLSLGVGFNYKIYSIRIQKSKYIDRDINNTYYDWFPDYYRTLNIGLENFDISLSYLLIEDKIPLSLFVTIGAYSRFGIKANLSKMDL